MRRFTTALLTFVAVMLLPAYVPAQQAQNRLIEQRAIPWGEPLKIVAVKVKGTPVEINKSFTADDDWLKGLTFTLKNVSNKPIAYAELDLMFPAPAGLTVHGAVHHLRYGRNRAFPGAAGQNDSTRAIPPGETIDLSLSDTDVGGMVRPLLDHSGISAEVEKVIENIGSIFFEGDNNTMWRLGQLLQRDPSDPRRFNVVRKYVLSEELKEH